MRAIAFIGRSESGKDTAASYLQQKHDYRPIAFAEPLKRLAKAVYDFSDDQLYGKPSSRNAIDPRFSVFAYQRSVLRHLAIEGGEIDAILAEIFPGGVPLEARHLLAQQYMKVIYPQNATMTARKALQLLGTEWGRALQPDLWLRAMQRATGGEGRWAITDCRFRNEAEFVVKEMRGGAVFWIDADKRVPIKPEVAAHSSEPKFEDVKDLVRAVIDNNGTPEEFRENIERALRELGD